MPVSRVILPLVAALVAACRDGGSAGDTAPSEDGGGEGSGSGSSGGEDPEAAIDSCALAPALALGRTHGTLRDKSTDRGGACGTGGPDAFYRLEVTARADVSVSALGVGFVPRVGVLPDDCIGDFANVGLACARGLPLWIGDVAAATTLLVAVGADADDPALAAPIPEGMPDPLGFALDVHVRAVLDEGEPCQPATVGRCTTGTSCIGGEDGVARCTALVGDTCNTAEPIELGTGDTVYPLTPYTDAHAHSCTGAHRREKVLRVTLPQPIDPAAALVVSTTAADVGLAVRGPGCDLADERACASGGPTGATATVAGLAQAVAPGETVYVFVELPPLPTMGGEEPPPVQVQLQLAP
jgi:hypothetical protein